MEAALLMFDAVGITLVLLWAVRGHGRSGLFAWRADTARRNERPGGVTDRITDNLPGRGWRD